MRWNGPVKPEPEGQVIDEYNQDDVHSYDKWPAEFVNESYHDALLPIFGRPNMGDRIETLYWVFAETDLRGAGRV